MGWNKEDKWYSGQGTVLIAPRDVNGKPGRYDELGNCSSVKVSVATTTIDKKESKTGQRAIVKRLTTETKVSLMISMDNYIAKNLERSLRGKATIVAGGTVTAEAASLYPAGITALKHLKVSAVAVKQGATALTLYTDEQTAYDYKANTEAGSIQLNDGAVTALDKAGVVVTAVAVGTTTVLTVPNTLNAGDSISLRGFTGTDAADLNGKTFTVTSATTSTVTIPVVSTAKVYTATATTKAMFDGMAGAVDYTYADQIQVDALTTGAKEFYIRFEGLNTATEDQEPVVIEVFRFASDPLKELDLISDTFQAFSMEGPALADALQPTGSKFFRVTKLGGKNA